MKKDQTMSDQLLASLKRGLEQSATGDVVDLGDFTQFVDEDAAQDA